MKSGCHNKVRLSQQTIVYTFQCLRFRMYISWTLSINHHHPTVTIFPYKPYMRFVTTDTSPHRGTHIIYNLHSPNILLYTCVKPWERVGVVRGDVCVFLFFVVIVYGNLGGLVCGGFCVCVCVGFVWEMSVLCVCCVHNESLIPTPTYVHYDTCSLYATYYYKFNWKKSSKSRKFKKAWLIN